MDRYLLVRMENEEKEKMQIKIDNVKDEVTELEVKNIVTTIENAGIFAGKKGQLNIGAEAKLVEVNYREFNL